MKSTTLKRDGRVFASWIGGAALLAVAPLAWAVPPAFTGTPITAPIPAIGQTVVINLRQQGVISGSASISADTGQQVVFINGQPSGLLSIEPAILSGEPFGQVCLVITNNGYSPSTDTLTAPITLINQQQQAAGPTFVTIVNGAGPVINPNNPVQLATCSDPNQSPIVNAGLDRTIVDTDGSAGESVTLAGSATDPEGELLTYEWFLGSSQTVLVTGATPTVTLPDGVNQLRLVVTDEGGATGTDTVAITVQAAAGPTANAGVDRTVADTDNQPGEQVTLDGSLSTDSDGTITTYRWSLIEGGETETILGTSASPTLNVQLLDGENLVRLLITDDSGNQASATVTITVGEGAGITTLAELPNLTPNQRRVAVALDRICGQLRDLSGSEGPTLTADQQNLLIRCDGLQTGNTTQNQVAALDEMVADDFAVARTQTLLFANTQYASVMDRLMALRGGARGLSLAGLNIIVDGKSVPLAQLQDMAKGLLGGGASADEPGGLLSDKWGMWARGNYSFGEKDRNASSPGFDADQWAMVGGLDYRFSDRLVGGVSLAYGQSSIEFDPRDEGGLETDTWAISLYGSAYAAKNFYFDTIVNVANADYGADRNITYVDGTGLIDVDAHGDTDGMTYSAGLSGGYDLLIGGLTLSPNLGLFYIDATIDSFTESGAGGLNLLYDEQTFQSFTGNLGLRATYAWNLSWGVLLPHVRVDYVREFKNDVDVFGVRFAADPNAVSTPPILVETDNPDESYWRLATGFSAQFVLGVSAYVEYQRLESFEFISFQDVSFGLRMQRSF
jgi:outer membrane autotransporter protein